MIATAAFAIFAALLLGGALVTAFTRRAALAGLGLVLAILGASGLCVLLGRPGLALGLVGLSLAAVAALYTYISTGLGVARTLRSFRQPALLGLGALAAAAGLLQLALAILGVRLVLPVSDVAPVAEGPAAPDLTGGVVTAFDMALILWAALLVFAAFVTGRSLTGPGSPPAREARRAVPDLRQGLGAVNRRPD